MAVNQRHDYTDEHRAAVLALTRMGLGPTAIQEQTNIPVRTVTRWQSHWREVAIEQEDRQLIDDDYRIAARAGEMIHLGLDEIDEAGIYAKHLVTLNILRGTAVDKIIRRREHLRPPGEQRPTIVFVTDKAINLYHDPGSDGGLPPPSEPR